MAWSLSKRILFGFLLRNEVDCEANSMHSYLVVCCNKHKTMSLDGEKGRVQSIETMLNVIQKLGSDH